MSSRHALSPERARVEEETEALVCSVEASSPTNRTEASSLTTQQLKAMAYQDSLKKLAKEACRKRHSKKSVDAEYDFEDLHEASTELERLDDEIQQAKESIEFYEARKIKAREGLERLEASAAASSPQGIVVSSSQVTLTAKPPSPASSKAGIYKHPPPHGLWIGTGREFRSGMR